MKPGKIISIKATMPDGEILKSTNQIPICLIAYSTFPQKDQKENYKKNSSYPWLFKSDNKEINDILSFPQLEIDYEKYEGGKSILGIYYKNSISLVVDKAYINSIGYQYDPFLF